jgi:hypothetical protein
MCGEIENQEGLHHALSWSVCYSHFIHRGSKGLPRHPILEHLQTVFCLESERPSFTPMQNNRRNCSFLYFNLYLLTKLHVQASLVRLVIASRKRSNPLTTTLFLFSTHHRCLFFQNVNRHHFRIVNSTVLTATSYVRVSSMLLLRTVENDKIRASLVDFTDWRKLSTALKCCPVV